MGRTSSEPAEGATTPASWAAECTEAVADGEQLRLGIYVRSAEPEYGLHDYHGRVMDRVSELAADGTVERHEVHVWGDRLPIGDRASHAEDIAAFRAWAQDRGATLPFQVRECRSTIVDSAAAALVPPCVLVAVRCEGDLVGVVPSGEGERAISVMDFLTLLCEPDRRSDHRASAST